MPAYNAAYKPAGLEAGKYKDPIRGRRQGVRHGAKVPHTFHL
jgi:hypothetical protein